MTQDEKQLQVFPDRLLILRVDPAKKMHRFYLMTVQRDLFGGASLTREWGRIGSSGQVRVDYHADEGQAVDALADLATQKFKRGYKT
ncbi:WGR domain-containing protein [Halocynthiibacter namhaensis]|uniref:WGR domain-containing protein n=1 Tax=Halocynthiibacter namhaensis TaxID=1290553 RepID=UPI000578F7DC|nr:WGR domain-containing protein [Halocynthiibacter namhaensis]